MSYGVDGQSKSGTPRSVSTHVGRPRGDAGNNQSQRGFGPTRAANAANRGRMSPLTQLRRGFRQITSSPSTRVTSAGRVKKGR